MMMQVISQHYRPHLAQMMTATAVIVSPAIKPMSGAMKSHLCRLRSGLHGPLEEDVEVQGAE
jgi:hypothetical protein